ncbi:MAG: hypothetical protein M3506_05395, partial [Chloroflexota bacterium]|nr:hypothetical protein [Chloroflexota bacterium]
MSRRPPQHIEQRVRDLARQHPGWTPSQMAIFLQGEKLKVTSEDVRRVLARPAPTGADAEAPTAERPRYTAPREEQRRSAIPIGLLFGILFFLLKKFVVPNFEKTFSDRTQAIEGGLAAAESKQAEADARLAELEKQLADARHEAARIREEAREQGAQIVAEMREQAQT